MFAQLRPHTGVCISMHTFYLAHACLRLAVVRIAVDTPQGHFGKPACSHLGKTNPGEDKAIQHMDCKSGASGVGLLFGASTGA